jgi:hypothetical protein
MDTTWGIVGLVVDDIARTSTRINARAEDLVSQSYMQREVKLHGAN